MLQLFAPVDDPKQKQRYTFSLCVKSVICLPLWATPKQTKTFNLYFKHTILELFAPAGHPQSKFYFVLEKSTPQINVQRERIPFRLMYRMGIQTPGGGANDFTV